MPSIRIRRTRRSVNADVRVPGDKSISHRALMCASIARGVSQISGANVGADVSSTLDALRAVGVQVVTDSNGTISVQGVDEFRDPREVIDCGNSGSTLRMLAGLFAGRVNARLDGDESLRRRPIERVAEPLRQMGASVATGADGRPPVVLRRSREPLRGRRIELPVASAQVKSAVAFAALRAD